MHFKKSIKVFLILFILFAILDCAFLYLIPIFFTSSVQEYLIKKIVEYKTTAQIELSMNPIKTYSDFSFQASANYINLKNEDSEIIFSGKDIELNAFIFPLLLKKASVNHFNMKKFQFNLKRFPDGEYNVKKIFKNSTNNPFNFTFTKLKCNIEDYELNFTDEYNNKKMFLEGDYFRINNFVSSKFIDIDTSGMLLTEWTHEIPFNIKFASKLPLSFSSDLSQTILEGYFENLSINYFKPYLTEYVSDDIVEASSDMSFEFHTTTTGDKDNSKKFLIKGSIDNLLFDKTSMEGKISSDSKVHIDALFSYANKKISISNLNINSDGFDIKSGGEIQFFDNEKPEIDMTVTVEESQAEDIAKILPTNIIPKDSDHKDVIKKIKKYNLYGDLKGQVLIKGKIPRPNITGYVLVKKFHLFEQNDRTHNATVDIKFQGNTMLIDVDVKVINNQWATVKGFAYLFNDGINHFDIKSCDNLDLALAQKIVLPVQDVLQFELGPIPMMKIEKGTGAIDVKVDGTRFEGSLYGQALFKDGVVSYNGLAGKVEDARGIVDFNDRLVSYDANGYFSGYSINVSGKAVQNEIVEINIGSDAIETSNVIELINNSPLLIEVKQGLAALENVSGKAKINFTMRGDVTAFQNAKSDEIKTRGTVYLFNDKCNLIGFYTPLNSIKGIVEFTDKDVIFEKISANIEDSPINISGKILINRETKIPDIDVIVTGDGIKTGDTIRFLTESDMSRQNNIPDISNIYSLESKHDLLFKYKAQSTDFDIKKAYAVLNFLPNTNLNSPLKINSGKIVLDNSKVNVENVSADFFNTKAKIDGDIKHVDTTQPLYNLDIESKDFNFATLPEIRNLSVIPDSAKNFINTFENYKGSADIDMSIKNNNMSGFIDVSTLTFKNKQNHIPITIPNTRFEIKGNKLSSKNLNAKVGTTNINGDIALSEIGRNNNINAHLTTKVTKDFTNAYVNSFLPHPVFVSGDISLYTEIKGNLNNMNVSPHLTFYPGADAVYLNTKLGNSEEVREFLGNINISPSEILIKDFKFNRSKNTIFTVNGKFLKENELMKPDFVSLNINDKLPVIYINPVFENEIFKNGEMTGSIKYYFDDEAGYPKLSGALYGKNAKLTGDIEVNSFKLKTDKNNININLNGNVSKSDVSVDSIIKNNLNFPINIDNLNISSSSLDNITLIDALNSAREEYIKKEKTEEETHKHQKILNINSGDVNIDVLNYKNLVIENIKAKYNYDEDNVFRLKDIQANISEGTIEADASFSMLTGEIEANVSFSDVDSNAVAENVFGAKNQLYGTGHGRLVIKTKGKNVDDRIKNLNGECYFVIIDGKMPKLGSLESLLRASNILKSGVSGFTINNVLDLLNFAKTGSFMSINGSFEILDGVVDDINVFSQGNNLSLYMNGKYNIEKEIANVEIWGKLSNKLSTLLGPLGNTSINSFFSMIPGISASENEIKVFNENIEKIPPLEYSNDDYKIFQAIIDGNINSGSEYVKSFKWVEN